MTAEEFNYYNNALIRMSQHQNFALKNRWSQKYLADYLGISIPALPKIKTGIPDISLSRLDLIASLYKRL